MQAQLALTEPPPGGYGAAGGGGGYGSSGYGYGGAPSVVGSIDSSFIGGGGGGPGGGGGGGLLSRIPDDSERHADLRSATEALAASLTLAARGAANAAGEPGAGGGGALTAARLQAAAFASPGWGGSGSVLGSHADVVLRWCREQIQGARDSIEATSSVLRLLRQEAALLRIRPRASMAVSARVSKISWALNKGAATLVQGDLQVGGCLRWLLLG
jgi:hypothetical protein